MKTVPLNSFVVLSGVGIDHARELFNGTEIIDAGDLSKVMAPRIRSLDSSTYAEYVWDIAKMRLRFGERVVVHAPQISYDDKLALVNKARKIGFHPIFLCTSTARDYPKCDSSIEVIDVDRPVKIINFIGDKNFFQEIKKQGFAGVTVVPDLHGSMHAFRSAVSSARSEGNFIVFLGDLLDYGPEPLQVVDEVYHMVVRGEAEAIMGNHERKIHRYLAQVKTNGDSKMKLSEGNLVTLSKLADLHSSDTNIWVHRFNSLVNMMRHHRVSGSVMFAHAGVTADMWKSSTFRLSGDNESMALFGEVERDATATSSLIRAYSWVDVVPENHVVFVGHDNRGGDEPLIVDTTAGGKVYFLDTGCGKGGHLSTIAIKFAGNGFTIQPTSSH